LWIINLITINYDLESVIDTIDVRSDGSLFLLKDLTSFLGKFNFTVLLTDDGSCCSREYIFLNKKKQIDSLLYFEK
jgi:hypothetical protein